MTIHEAEACAACGRVLDGKIKLLFGQPVHGSCSNGFNLRRQVAYVLDCVLWFVLLMVVLRVLIGPSGDPGPTLSKALLVFGFEIFMAALFLARDGAVGTSPGKWVTGLQVVDVRSGAPIGVEQSIRRNLILLVPLMPLVLVFQMRGGPRWGDASARTRVVIRSQQTARAFSVTENPFEDWGSTVIEL